MKASSNNPQLQNALQKILNRLDLVERLARREIHIGPGMYSQHGDEEHLCLEARGGGGGGSFLKGFVVRRAGTATDPSKLLIKVTPSVVTGLPASYVPKMNGTRLDAEETPTLEVAAESSVYLRVEIEPDTRVIQVLAESGTENKTVLDSGGDVVDGEITVVTDGEGADAEVPRPAEIDADGNKVNGIFYVPLAYINSSLQIHQLTYGPQMWEYVGSVGALAVYPPTVVHTGDIVTVIEE